MNEQWNEEWMPEEGEDDDKWLLDIFREAARRDEGNVYVCVPEQLRRVERALKAVHRVFKDQEVKVSCKLHDPTLDWGAITIEGVSMSFTSMIPVAQLLLITDSIDIWPKTNGTVEVVLGYKGLVKKVGRLE